jgi:hypothetical protein
VTTLPFVGLAMLAESVKTADTTYAGEISLYCNTGDVERDHALADEYLIALLETYGFKRTTSAFKAVSKWYS